MYLVYYPPIFLVILFIVHGIIKEEKKVIVYNSLLGHFQVFLNYILNFTLMDLGAAATSFLKQVYNIKRSVRRELNLINCIAAEGSFIYNP
jgi:hypothetical protein